VKDRNLKPMIVKVYRELPGKIRDQIGSAIAGVGEDDLPTAVRPFMFQGRTFKELIFDPQKLRLFNQREKVGAVACAFIISSLAAVPKARIPMSNQALMQYRESLRRYARKNSLKHQREFSEFLDKLNGLEDSWRESFNVE